jgi:hypothetical protein
MQKKLTKAYDLPGVFEQLFANMDRTNPCVYALPDTIRKFFDGGELSSVSVTPSSPLL